MLVAAGHHGEGAVFAMIAAVLVDGARARLARHGADWAPFVVICLCLLGVAGLEALVLPRLDAPAHAGGLIVGLGCGRFLPRRAPKDSGPFLQSAGPASP